MPEADGDENIRKISFRQGKMEGKPHDINPLCGICDRHWLFLEQYSLVRLSNSLLYSVDRIIKKVSISINKNRYVYIEQVSL